MIDAVRPQAPTAAPQSMRAQRPGGGRPPLLLLLPALLAAGVALLPMIYLAVRALQNGPAYALDVLLRERTARLVVRSLLLATTVTVASLVLGVSLAWIVTRTDVPARRVWAVLAALPLALPTYVAATMWYSAVPAIAGFGGAALVLTLCCYPYVYLPVAAGLERADPAVEEVARALGCPPLRTFLTVTLRQVRPAAAAGALLVGLYVLSDFGAVQILRYDTFTRVIYTSYRASFDRTPAAVLGVLLVLLTVAIVYAESRSRGRASQARVGGGAQRAVRRLALGQATPLAVGWLVAVAVAALGVPVTVLGYWLARGASAGIDVSALAAATASTLAVSALGAVLTLGLAIPVGVIAARYAGGRAGWLARSLEQATYAGHALPGLVVALSFVFLAVRYAAPFYQRTPLLVLAYAVLFLPAAVGSVRAAVGQSSPRLEEVARSLGHRPAAVLRQVTLRLAAPGIAAGGALVFLTCMKELPATLLLRPTGTETLATQLWSAVDLGRYAAAAPYAALLLLAAAVPTFVLGRGASGTRVALEAEGGGTP